MQPKTIASISLDPNRTALISLRAAGVVTPDGRLPAGADTGEIVIEYPDDWSFAAPDPSPSGRRIDDGDSPDDALRFVLQARNWCLVDLVFELRAAGDDRGARLLAGELLELCPRLNRGAIRLLRTLGKSGGAKVRNRCDRDSAG